MLHTETVFGKPPEHFSVVGGREARGRPFHGNEVEATVNRVLVPLRGDINLDRILAINVTPVDHPSPLQNIEADRAEHQRDLLENAHDVATEMDVTLRTRAVVAPDVGEAILDVIEEEAADEILLGWDGTVDHDGHVFDSAVGPVVRDAGCDASLVALRAETVGTPVALVAADANAPVVAHQAVEFATVDGTVPTLLNVQPPRGESDSAAEQRGRAVIADAAEAAGIDPGEYDTEVVVDGDIGRALDEVTSRYDTVCVGLSERPEGSRTPSGTVIGRFGEGVPGNVALIQGS